MTIRVTAHAESTRTRIKIDGRLKVIDLDELNQFLRGVPGLIVLDLSELHSIDRASADALKQLIESGVELRSVSRFVELMVRSGSRNLHQIDGET